MRDADAQTAIRQMVKLLEALERDMPAARQRLRDWKSEGYPGGAGESSIGGDRHSDPTVAAVTRTAVIDRAGVQHGYRTRDAHDDQLKSIDKDLHRAAVLLADLAGEVSNIIELGKEPPAGIEGCAICDGTTRAMGAAGNVLHTCDGDCRKAEHRHPNDHQAIHSRTAPAVEYEPDTEDEDKLAEIPRCQFHYDFAKRYAVDAHADITRWHLDHLGDRVPYAVIREHHPDAFERYHGTRRTA